MQNSQIIHEFMKNATEKVRVDFSEFKGMDLISVRVFYNADEAGDDWRPTKKGITLRSDLLPELKKAVDKAYEEWQE